MCGDTAGDTRLRPRSAGKINGGVPRDGHTRDVRYDTRGLCGDTRVTPVEGRGRFDRQVVLTAAPRCRNDLRPLAPRGRGVAHICDDQRQRRSRFILLLRQRAEGSR